MTAFHEASHHEASHFQMPVLRGFNTQARHSMNTPLPCPDSTLLDVIRDGSISPEQEQKITQHLEHCPRCRAVVEMLSLDDNMDVIAEP
jgi:hypothetical protein